MNYFSQMLEHARRAMQNAYAPYSKFHVGVCIRTANDKLFAGCNNENASYSLTQCAEASAIGAMITAGEKRIEEVLIVASHDDPCTPCGSCRQRIREFAEDSIKITMVGLQGKQLEMTLGELLPKSFGPEFLEGKQ